LGFVIVIVASQKYAGVDFLYCTVLFIFHTNVSPFLV